eukprot:9466987-Pyramimonas_sp.AAC.1
MIQLLKHLGLDKEILKLCWRIPTELCDGCQRVALPMTKPAVRASTATRFNQRVQGDLFF